jgi:hypothetical protein
MKTIFAGLKKMRDLERLHLPFVRSVADFDIVIEIGFAEEQGKPLTVKQFVLLNICSHSTIRRKLSVLVRKDIVIRRKHATDNRTTHLFISSAALKMLDRYGRDIKAISGLHFGALAKQRK